MEIFDGFVSCVANFSLVGTRTGVEVAVGAGLVPVGSMTAVNVGPAGRTFVALPWT